MQHNMACSSLAALPATLAGCVGSLWACHRRLRTAGGSITTELNPSSWRTTCAEQGSRWHGRGSRAEVLLWHCAIRSHQCLPSPAPPKATNLQRCLPHRWQAKVWLREHKTTRGGLHFEQAAQGPAGTCGRKQAPTRGANVWLCHRRHPGHHAESGPGSPGPDVSLQIPCHHISAVHRPAKGEGADVAVPHNIWTHQRLPLTLGLGHSIGEHAGGRTTRRGSGHCLFLLHPGHPGAGSCCCSCAHLGCPSTAAMPILTVQPPLSSATTLCAAILGHDRQPGSCLRLPQCRPPAAAHREQRPPLPYQPLLMSGAQVSTPDGRSPRRRHLAASDGCGGVCVRWWSTIESTIPLGPAAGGCIASSSTRPSSESKSPA